MKSLGERIRELRIANELLLREVASRLERSQKHPTRDQVLKLAKILKADVTEFLVLYLSEKVLYELKGESLALRAIQAAEKIIAYEKRKRSSPKAAMQA
jgi:transcriptional regulator with XRE-family HTH domain